MLSNADLREALDVAGTSAACRTMTDVRDHLLPALGHLCRALSVVHHQISLSTLVEVDVAWPASVFSVERLTAYATVQDQHPLVGHFRTHDERGVVVMSDLVPRRVWRSSAVYVVSHRDLGVDDQMSVVLGVREGCHHGLSVSRLGRAFGDRERDLLTLLLPSVRSALRSALSSGAAYEAVRVGPAAAPLTVEGEALPPRGGLTAREWQVLRLLATGLTNAQAARRLGISARTVDKHVEHVHVKLGASCRLDAVARGRELLEPTW